MKGFFITITKEKMQHAEKIARERWRRHRQNKSEHKNNYYLSDEQKIKNDIMGTQGEGAGQDFFSPIIWHDDVDGRGTSKPDLEGRNVNIDMKTRPAHARSMIVRKGTFDGKPHLLNWAFCHAVAVDPPLFRIVGWAWGYEIFAIRLTEPLPGRPAHVIDEADDLLKCPSLLYEIEHGRKYAPVDYTVDGIPLPPDLESLCRKHRGYSFIPADAWRTYDQALIDWKASRGMGTGTEIGSIGIRRDGK